MGSRANWIDRVVLGLVERLKDRIRVDRILLFGSRAYGRPTRRSDLDLAVVSRQFRHMGDIERIMLLSDSARRVNAPVDIDALGFTPEELEGSDYFDIGGEILEKGIVIYEARR